MKTKKCSYDTLLEQIENLEIQIVEQEAYITDLERYIDQLEGYFPSSTTKKLLN